MAVADERRFLGVGSHRSSEDRGRFFPESAAAVILLDGSLHRHRVVVVSSGESSWLEEARR
ncbi:MAG: hypothetical protein ACP5P9_11200 [Acidimicrobiales bacterium]